MVAFPTHAQPMIARLSRPLGKPAMTTFIPIACFNGEDTGDGTEDIGPLLAD
jgi:hypothetical protein